MHAQKLLAEQPNIIRILTYSSVSRYFPTCFQPSDSKNIHWLPLLLLLQKTIPKSRDHRRQHIKSSRGRSRQIKRKEKEERYREIEFLYDTFYQYDLSFVGYVVHLYDPYNSWVPVQAFGR